MTIHFFEPPAAQKVGGLELAIRSLETYLVGAGVVVRTNTPVGELGRSGERELVHFHGLWQPKFLKISAACRQRHLPYVVSPHGMLEPWAWRHKRWKKWPWFHLFERRHLSGARRLLTTSQGESDNLSAFFPPKKCLALPLGLTSVQQPDYVTARRKLGWGESELVALFLSRVHPKKGLHLLLHALTRLDVASRSRLRLVVVGGGENRYLGELKNFAVAMRGRLPRVDWQGEIWGDGKWPYLQGADLFCLPSYSENFGLVVLEALQVGTRVLTTNQTPWGMVPAWGGGWIAEPTEESVNTALGQFLSNTEWPEERRRQLAGKVQSEFSWSQIGPDYLRFYESEIQAAGGACSYS